MITFLIPICAEGQKLTTWRPALRDPGSGVAQTCPLVLPFPGSAEDGPRVVFMVDLWHPNVAAAERQALDFIFAPGR